MGFHVGRAGAGADAAQFVFYEELANERLAETVGMASVSELVRLPVGRLWEHTAISVEHQNALGMAHHRGECWQMSDSCFCP